MENLFFDIGFIIENSAHHCFDVEFFFIVFIVYLNGEFAHTYVVGSVFHVVGILVFKLNFSSVFVLVDKINFCWG